MKRNYFFGMAALCGLLAFTSCGSDDDPILDGPGNNEVATGEQVIVLDMQDTDVLSTKSRPLYSTDNRGSEDVTDVMLYIFKEETGKQKLVKTIHVDNWDNTCEEYKYGRKRTIKLEGENKLKDGTFTIYAVGQNETEVEGNPVPFKFQGATDAPGQDNQWKDIPGLLLSADAINNSIFHNFATTPGSGFPYLFTKAVSYKGGGDAFASRVVGEVFSGQSKPVTLEPGDKSVSWTVLLKRQVAGVLGYFSNIPAEGMFDNQTECWSTKLRLVASNRNDRLDMTIQLNKQNDDATEVGKDKIVNGFKSANDLEKDAYFKGGKDNAYIVYEINLEDWFTIGTNNGWDDVAEEIDNKKYLGKTSKWKNPYEGTNAAVTVADGAVLAGEFVIPFDKDETLNTFELQLMGKKKGKGANFEGEDEYILQTWAVKLDDTSIDAAKGDGPKHYSVYRNHLYQIGKRGGGDDPDKPGVDPDKPQPLDKSQELVIKINDQWEFIHDLEID